MLSPVLEHLIFDSHLDLIGRCMCGWVWAGAADNNSSHCCRSRRWWTRSWGNVMPIDRRRLLMRTTIITTSGCYFMVNTVRKHISVNVLCHWGQVCVVLQVLRSSTPSSTKALTSATLTLVGCLEQESTLQRIHQRATSMSTASEEGPAVRRTKIGPAISATGNWTSNPVWPVAKWGFNGSIQLDGRGLTSLLWSLRQMLFCRVTLGKSFLQFSAMKMAHAPPGHHSVIGRPSVNGLAYAEYVIYRGEQVKLPPTPH